MAVCQGQFSQPRDAPRVKSTVSDTLNHMAAVFRENGHNNPKRDAEHNVARLLRNQLRLHKKDNPKKVQQKALAVCVLCLTFPQNSQNFAKQQKTHMSRPLLGNALARVSTSSKSGAKASKGTVPPKYQLHQRQQNPRPQLCLSSFGKLRFGHVRTTEK